MTSPEAAGFWASAVTALNVRAMPGRSQAPTTAVAGNPLTQAQSGFHIPVTSDHVRVSAVTEATARADRIAQACDERVCLPPSELPFVIASAGR